MSDPRTPPRPALPRGIWVLGFVSLLMDASSEMIHSLLPLFLVGTLGASALLLGLMEGAAEATALFARVVSGPLSDWLGRRKGLVVLGYALGTASKPLFALASAPGLVLGARLVDRIGKGIRGAPRDALIADIAPPDMRGAAFGLRQSLDTVGAFVGPLLAIALMLLWANDFRAVFWVAVIPGVLAVLLLFFGVREPEPATVAQRPRLEWRTLARLDRPYWWVVGIGALFTLARFSEAFLVLRAGQSGLPLAWVPLVMVVMNLVYSLSAYPLGQLADRLPRGRLLLAGMALLVVADLMLAWSSHWSVVLVGVAIWGLHLGMTQGLLAALVADTAPTDLRGTGYGFFNLASGVALLVASALAGLLWDRFGAPATFLAGAGLSAAAALLLVLRPCVCDQARPLSP